MHYLLNLTFPSISQHIHFFNYIVLNQLSLSQTITCNNSELSYDVVQREKNHYSGIFLCEFLSLTGPVSVFIFHHTHV